jgi:hypothetical protein
MRVMTAATSTGFKGVSVTATSSADIAGVGVSAAIAGAAPVGVSGTVQIVSRNTAAYIGKSAKVNVATPSPDAAQSVNVASGDVYFTVASVSGSILTLSGGDTIATEFGKTITVQRIVLDPSYEAVAENANIPVTFTNNGATPLGRPGDTITRTDGGSWIADGYVVGSLLRIIGATVNATGTGISYRVVEVTASTLKLFSSTVLTTETDPVPVTITRGRAPVVTAIVIDQRDDVNVTATGILTVTAAAGVLIGSEEDMRVNVVTAGGGEDRIIVNLLPSLTSTTGGVRDTVDLDGQGGADFYTVNATNTRW